MDLPSKQQCHVLWDKYKMPEHIRRHTLQVTKVGDVIARHIQHQGIEVDLELVNRAGLLHDISKIIAIKNSTDRHHGAVGEELLNQEGIDPKLAQIVAHHGMHHFNKDLSIEAKIVNYADKRVKHDEIVSFDDRIADLKVRYNHDNDTMDLIAPKFYEFEEKWGLRDLSFEE